MLARARAFCRASVHRRQQPRWRWRADGTEHGDNPVHTPDFASFITREDTRDNTMTRDKMNDGLNLGHLRRRRHGLHFAARVWLSAGSALLFALPATVPVHAHDMDAPAVGAEAQHHDANAATAFGRSGNPRNARRTIDIEMSDELRFTPASIEVKQGETVRLRIQNRGAMAHEFVLGTQDELAEHARLMLKFPGMVHEETFMAHLEAGTNGEIVWQFSKRGSFKYACLIPGHAGENLRTGMVGTVTVK